MSRDQVPIGTERKALNGYWYVKTKDGQRLKHHIVAEEMLGRPINSSVERVLFVDGNKDNFDPSNIEVVLKKTGPTKEERIEMLKAELAELEDQSA